MRGTSTVHTSQGLEIERFENILLITDFTNVVFLNPKRNIFRIPWRPPKWSQPFQALRVQQGTEAMFEGGTESGLLSLNSVLH